MTLRVRVLRFVKWALRIGKANDTHMVWGGTKRRSESGAKAEGEALSRTDL